MLPLEPSVIIRSGESYLRKDGRELVFTFNDAPYTVNPADPPTVTMNVFRKAPDPERGLLASGFVLQRVFEMRENSASFEIPASLTVYLGEMAHPEGRLWVEFLTPLGGDTGMWLEVKD